MKDKRSPLTFDDAGPPPPAPDLPPPDVADDDELTLVVPAAPDTAETAVRLARFDSPPPSYPASPPPRRGKGVYWLAAAASGLWAGGMIGLVLAYQQRLGFFVYEPFTITVFCALALAPLGLIWLCVFALRQGAAFADAASRSKDYAERMLEPAALSAAEAGSVVESIRQQIALATTTATQAHAELANLRDMLADETDRIMQSAEASRHTAMILVEGLGRERQELTTLSEAIDGQAAAIAEAITRQARMVAEASDLAQTQIAEAEAHLAARAADLAAAAGEASSAARLAGEDIARQAARLEAAGATVGDQIQVVEESLGQQRAALVTAAVELRAEQEDLAMQIENQRAQLVEVLTQSEDNVARLGDMAEKGAGKIRELTSAASDEFRVIADAAQTERDLLGASALQSMAAMSEAAAFERRALEEETRRAIEALQAASEEAHRSAESASDAARTKVEQLSEAAFAAGQKADGVFEARLNEARSLIERTAQLVEEAGDRSAARLDHSIEEARAALAELERGMAMMEQRSAGLPMEVQARTQEIAQAIEQANQTLLDSARRAAEETQAIDSAFQERVKRNYEMLSEAVRLMGVIGGGASARASGGAPARPLRPPPAASSLRPSPGVDPVPAAPSATAPIDTDRPRLRLTPTDDPAAPPPLTLRDPGAAPTPSAAAPEEWTWKDLLGAVDDGVSAEDDEALASVLIREIELLGVDLSGLLPRSRVDEALGALNAGNPAGARESVRRLAPAAIRRLSRRVLSDKVLRGQAERFVQSYQSLLREARESDSDVAPYELLMSDPGRAFLLLDAAVGDLG